MDLDEANSVAESEFDAAISELARKRAVADPATLMKARLAPDREQNERNRAEFLELVALAGPILSNANAVMARCNAQNIRHPYLEHQLQEAVRCCMTGHVNFDFMQQRIDGVTNLKILRNRSLESELKCDIGQAAASTSALRSCLTKIPLLLQELEKFVLEAAGQPPQPAPQPVPVLEGGVDVNKIVERAEAESLKTRFLRPIFPKEG